MNLNLNYHQSIIKYIFPIGIGLLGYTIGFLTHNYFYKILVPAPTVENRLPGSYKFINPLLECDNSAVSRDTNLDNLKNKVAEQIDPEKTSVYYRDMNNGPWFGIREKELFSPASLIKVPLMMAYLKRAEADPTILDQLIVNTTVFNPKSQNIQPEVTLTPNQKYTTRQLIEQMIIYSDDDSYNLLNQKMPLDEILKVYHDLGVDTSKALADPNGNVLSVKAYASFFRILFNASYLNPEMSEYALKILSQVKFKDGLINGLPSNITAAHKFGERQYLDTGLKQLHDCGIVYVPKKPYLLCIMTRGTDFKELEKTISSISKTVYDSVSQNN